MSNFLEDRTDSYKVVTDITNLNRTEDALLEAKQRAEISNRTKNEFLANMSHELRTPMNGILGMLQLLQMTNVDEEQNKYISLAIQSANRLTCLLSDILDLSKIDTMRMSIQSKPLNIGEVLSDVSELFKPLALQNNIEFICHINPAIPQQMNGDATRLEQVLINFIGNAFKFTKKGRITVEAHPLPIRIQNRYKILFSISDTGIGIPDDKFQKLFKPFSQVSEGSRREYQGAGLSLAICKKIIELMGGTITIESDFGIGTRINFCAIFNL